MTIMLRLVRIGVWSEIATAAVSVSKHRGVQAEIVEFHATRRRQPPIASSAAAVPMNSTNEAVPPNDRYWNQLIEAATGNSPIHAARSPLRNWEWHTPQGTNDAATAKPARTTIALRHLFVIMKQGRKAAVARRKPK